MEGRLSVGRLGGWVRVALVVAICPLSAVGQVASGLAKATAAPPGWMEKWVGVYGRQDFLGKEVPPGFKVLNPYKDEMDERIVSQLQPWARLRRESIDPEVEDPGILCKATGLFRANSTEGFELLVSPGRITLIGMGGGGINTGGIRRIYLNRPHLKSPAPLWNGDSVGHWEGDTLVIDTIGFNDRTWLGPDREPHTEELHVVERLRFVANGTYLEHLWTFDDPQALTSPFSLSRYHKKLAADTPVAENVCEDTPDARRAWLKIHNRAVEDWDETRRGLGATAQ